MTFNLIIMFFPTIDYVTFRHVADGMLILMILYSFFSYFKNKSLAFLFYGINLIIGLTEHYMVDQFHLKGVYDISTTEYVFEMTCIAVISYCVFMIKTFDIHIQDKYFFKGVYSIISIIFLTILINIIAKTNNFEFITPWIYGIAITSCSALFVSVFKRLYKLTFSFMKYYLIGSIFVSIGWFLKCIFQAYPDYFPSIISFQHNNAFTYPNTYGQLGVIFEATFIFIAISESHKLLELSRLDLKKKIILSIEEKNNDDKILIETKQKILVTVITPFSQKLKHILLSVEQIIQALNIRDSLTAKPLFSTINNLSSESVQIIRSIVREFSLQNELILNKSIESKALEISKYHLSQKQITFSLYVNESELWQNIDDDFEEHILIFYEYILKVFIKYKEILHLFITFSINNDKDLFLLIQDDGQKFKSKKRMIYDLNLIQLELEKWQGKMQYSIEDYEESTIRVHFTITTHK